jgi:hypothetical protein
MTAVLTPGAALSSAPVGYTAAVSAAVKDVAGNSLAAGFEFAFTTADATRPSIVSTVPANLATNVPASVAVSATFDKPMDPATVNGSTFTLRLTGSGASIAGNVAYDNATRTATYTPAAPLASLTAIRRRSSRRRRTPAEQSRVEHFVDIHDGGQRSTNSERRFSGEWRHEHSDRDVDCSHVQ